MVKGDIIRVVNDVDLVKKVQDTGHGGFSDSTKKVSLRSLFCIHQTYTKLLILVKFMYPLLSSIHTSYHKCQCNHGN